MHATLTLLGTGAAFTDPHRTTTMLAVATPTESILIDCGGDVIQRFLASGHKIDTLSGIILTHEHPDHVGGFPLFMEKIWLAGRRRPIPVYGPASAIDQACRAFDTFNTSGWEGLPDIEVHEIELTESNAFLEVGPLRFTSSPGDHGVPVIGVRVENADTHKAVAYSCDTRPSESITRLASEVDVLVHEATGHGAVHSSIEEAARVARVAGVGRLVLVHLPPDISEEDLEEGRGIFKQTVFGTELEQYVF